jgi:hypothetical protein
VPEASRPRATSYNLKEMTVLNITIILLGLTACLFIWNAIIWSHKGIANFMLKLFFAEFGLCAFIICYYLFTSTKSVSITEEAFIPLRTFMWTSAITLGILGFTWRSTGGLNLFMKFIHMALAIGCAVWLMI